MHDEPDDRLSAELQSLERQARRLETAHSIIQAVHDELSLNKVLEGIVESFVEVGGFAGAEIAIDAKIDSLHVKHTSQTGVISSDEAVTRRTPVFIRGQEIGTVTAYCVAPEQLEEQSELLEFVLPTLFMGIDHAVSFAEVIDYRNTLEQRVEERTAQLVEAHAQLERTIDDLREARAARDRFFANINHEIRTPLTLIQLAVEQIERAGGNPSVTSDKLDEIKASTRRLMQLVNTLLLLSAGGEGKVQIRPSAIDIAAVLQRLVRTWTTAAERGGVDISYSGPEECGGVVDEAALETIIGNLLSNAVKFTPSGGLITVLLLAERDRVTIIVRDTGSGIDEEFMQRMFGRFERSADATARGIRGSGIGLSLSKELVELQRGTIEATRHEHPSGTSFKVVIPRHQPIVAVAANSDGTSVATPIQLPQELSPQAARPHPPTRKKEIAEATILLAEDDPALARHMVEILAEKYDVVHAMNGRDALEVAAKHMPDVLITDLDMPEMNGLELTKRFLEMQGNALTPVLIVSAYSGLGERLAGFEAGAVDYVLKPFSADELHARIRSQLALRKLALKLHESEALASMGVMSAGLAHELRNPANAIINALEPLWSLLPASEQEPDAVGAQLYEILTTAASNMRELCSNILNISRSGPVTRRLEDFTALLGRVRLVLRSVLAKVRVIEDLQLDRALYCAGPMIEQILINLIDNAAYAAGPGGEVRIAAWAEEDYAIIEVSDSGPGVPANLHKKIFDPFFTTKPIGEGTGLGLAVSRRIALNHGGDLRVVRRGVGTAFRLELPWQAKA
ncbi:MAG: response regulator [Kofleriaceae bacterium]|nr:response regulator [Kofleriaceae bacterium]